MFEIGRVHQTVPWKTWREDERQDASRDSQLQLATSYRKCLAPLCLFFQPLYQSSIAGRCDRCAVYDVQCARLDKLVAVAIHPLASLSRMSRSLSRSFPYLRLACRSFPCVSEPDGGFSCSFLLAFIVVSLLAFFLFTFSTVLSLFPYSVVFCLTTPGLFWTFPSTSCCFCRVCLRRTCQAKTVCLNCRLKLF